MLNKYFLIDKSFNLNNLNNYSLSLQVNLKGFSFCILDRLRNKFIGIFSYEYEKIYSYNVLCEEIENIIEQNKYLHYEYQHIKILYATPKFTFIPYPLYDKKLNKKTFGFNHDISEEETLMENYIYGISSYVIYSVPNNLFNLFSKKFPKHLSYHHSCPQLEEITLKNKLNNTNSIIYVNIYPNLADFIYFKSNKLQLFNSFAFKTDTDFQYFILNTIDQLKISAKETPVTILGDIAKNDNKIEALKNYIKEINFADKPSNFEYSYVFNEIYNHSFVPLLNLYQCV